MTRGGGESSLNRQVNALSEKANSFLSSGTGPRKEVISRERGVFDRGRNNDFKEKKYYGLSSCVRGHRGKRVSRDDRRKG